LQHQGLLEVVPGVDHSATSGRIDTQVELYLLLP
jgi:hypothetical protein